MTDHKIRAFFIQLGSNIDRKKGYDGPPVKDEEDCIYREEMYCQREVWTRVTSLLPKLSFNTLVIDIAEGVRLDSHPEIATKGAWTKDELREELARLRAIGLTPIPKFNFSPGHSAWMGDWAYRFGTPEFDVFCKEIIEETIDLFDTPPFFHIGEEEESAEVQHNYIAIARSPKKKAEDVRFLFDVIMKKGVRPAAWMDPDVFDALGGDVPQEVLFFTWHYGIHRDVETLAEASDYIKMIHRYATLGYDVVPTVSTWGWHLNAKEVMKACQKHVPSERIAGYMTASWMLTRENKYFALVNDAYTFYTAYRDVFGTLPKTDRKPWELLT